MPNNDAKEKLLLDNDAAVSLAKPFGRFDDNGEFNDRKVPVEDPYKKQVAPSLLNAGDIKKYVLATGLISPFFEGGGNKSRMKDASYEGRIGDSAYLFEADKTEPTQVFTKGDRVLKVPANSIVFVESDLYFRIPDFIALRFNLQIKHVHRGLLLGTGPLIDPGYWGKLCIPLHNLTDEDYYIPSDEGLIWIEFTKTTVINERIGRPPLGKEFKEIKPFLEKASRRFDRPSKRVGIRSSIPKAIEESANAAKKAQITLRTIGALGAFASFVALGAILVSAWQMHGTYVSDVRDGFAEVRPAISDLEEKFSNHMGLVEEAAQSEAQETLAQLSEMVSGLQDNVSSLTNLLEVERAERTIVEAEMREAGKASESQIRALREGVSNLCSSQENEELKRACLSVLAEPK